MGKLTVDECKRIIMQGKKQLTAAENRIIELEAELTELKQTVTARKLTAVQVLKAVEGHGNIMDNRLYEDWQSVADELNAEFGSGTCEPTEDGCCQYCGEDLIRCDMTIGDGGGAVELDPPIYHNYCPNCGRRVKR